MADPIETDGDGDSVSSTQHWSNNRLLGILVFLLVLYTLALAASLIVPLLLSLLLGLMLAPAVRWLCKWRIPRPLASIMVLGITLAFCVTILASLVNPAQEWLAHAPKAIDRMEQIARELRKPFVVASNATQEIIHLTATEGEEKPVRVVDATAGPFSQIISATPALLVSSTVTLFLTFALLLHGDDMLRKFVELAPRLKAKKEIVMATRSVQTELSAYVITISLINIALGLITSLALWWMGIKNPLLWGGVAGLLNFAPYLGPLLTVIILTVVGFTDFSAAFAALTVPGIFLVLHLIEGQAVTPLIVGQRLALDPIMVFLAMLVLGWLLGVGGLLMAVPLMTCLKILAEQVPEWHILARVLSAHGSLSSPNIGT